MPIRTAAARKEQMEQAGWVTTSKDPVNMCRSFLNALYGERLLVRPARGNYQLRTKERTEAEKAAVHGAGTHLPQLAEGLLRVGLTPVRGPVDRGDVQGGS